MEVNARGSWLLWITRRCPFLGIGGPDNKAAAVGWVELFRETHQPRVRVVMGFEELNPSYGRDLI
jgi:hypothetical protein